jgi:acylpyruvate hydrolase
MRLVTVAVGGGTSAAVETGDGLAALLDANGRRYADVGELLRHEPDPRAARTEPLPGPHRLLRPVLAPGAVVCVGVNYRAHALEMGRELPPAPTYFSKLARALTDPEAEVALPSHSQTVDYEGELAVVIGTGGRDIPVDKAWAAIAGVTLLNDVSMRDFQRRTSQFFAGKTWQRSTPVGPAVVTLDELPDLGAREIVTSVNGEERQRAPIDDLIFDVPALVADLSRIVELEPGDLISTGTPGGVGDAMEPSSYLRAGDVVEISVDGVGTLRTTFVSV